jgi:hypothetical protein
MQKETDKFNKSDVMEGMSSISAVIKAIEANTTDRKINTVFVDKAKKKSKEKEIAFLRRKSLMLGFAVEFTDEISINEITCYEH